MSAEIATVPTFFRIDRAALGVDPRLHLAATYSREVEANIARVWENDFDWEHLPALHAQYFCDVRLLEEHARGWRVAVTRQPGGPDWRIVIELDAEREHARYRVRISEGDGSGTRSGPSLPPAMPVARLSRLGSTCRAKHPSRSPISARPIALLTQGCGMRTSA